MKMLFALIALTLLTVSCSKEDAKKKAADLVTTNLSNVVVAQLQCAQPDAVKADIKAKVDDLFKVQAQTDSVGSMFCNSVVEIIVPQLVQAGIPATWECTAANATDKVVELAKQGCAKL
jgi:hypothetical protein